MQKCKIRLQNDIDWEDYESEQNLHPMLLAQEWVEKHPEWYSKSVALDGDKVLFVEVLDEDIIRTFQITITFLFKTIEIS